VDTHQSAQPRIVVVDTEHFTESMEGIASAIPFFFIKPNGISMNTTEIKDILEAHAKWIAGECGGTCADLQNVNLHDADLQNVNLKDANLQGANLCNANLQSAILDCAKLQNANLQGANLRNAFLFGIDLHEANLQNAKLQEANLQKANLQAAFLLRANLQDANLQDTNLQGAFLQEANLQGAFLLRANLQNANLQGANLQGAFLRMADLRGTDIDFTCWPLWCGSTNVTVDRRIAVQLAYHLCSLNCDDSEYATIRASLLPFACQIHRNDAPRLS